MTHAAGPSLAARLVVAANTGTTDAIGVKPDDCKGLDGATPMVEKITSDGVDVEWALAALLGRAASVVKRRAAGPAR
jgi:hypothetical protein